MWNGRADDGRSLTSLLATIAFQRAFMMIASREESRSFFLLHATLPPGPVHVSGMIVFSFTSESMRSKAGDKREYLVRWPFLCTRKEGGQKISFPL